MFIKLILKFKKKKSFVKDLIVGKNFKSFKMLKKSKYCHNVNVQFSWPVFLCPSYPDFQNSESVILNIFSCILKYFL